MVRTCSRRRALQAVSTAVTGAVAGCWGSTQKRAKQGSPTQSGTSVGCEERSDVGTDSYGILVYNKVGRHLSPSITVEEAWGEDTVATLEAPVDSQGCEEYDRVMTEPKEYVISAQLGYVKGPSHDKARHFIKPGSKTVPDVENVAIIVETRAIGAYDSGPWIFITANPDEIPKNACDDNC